MRGFKSALGAPIAVGPAWVVAMGAPASKTGSVEVTATFFATRVLIVSFTASLLMSRLRSVCDFQRVHDGGERTDAFEVRRSHEYLRADHAAGVDQFLDFEIGVRLDA